jgi:DNA-binding XRE family transcriptional regulator
MTVQQDTQRQRNFSPKIPQLTILLGGTRNSGLAKKHTIMIHLVYMSKPPHPKPVNPRFSATPPCQALIREAFLIEFTPETLRMLRLHRGYTQARLARQANISSDYLSELERERSQPSLELMGRLGQALEVVFFK